MESDFLVRVFDVIIGLIDYMFLGICKYISNGFRFIQLIISVMEHIVDFVATVLRYNRVLVSSVFDFIFKTVMFVKNIPQNCVLVMKHLIGVPILLMNDIGAYFVEQIRYLQVLFLLILYTICNLFTNICNIIYALCVNFYSYLRLFLGNKISAVMDNYVWFYTGIKTSMITTVNYCISGLLNIAFYIADDIRTLTKSFIQNGSDFFSSLNDFLFWMLSIPSMLCHVTVGLIDILNSVFKSSLFMAMDTALWIVDNTRFIFEGVFVFMLKFILEFCSAVVLCLEVGRNTVSSNICSAYENIAVGAKFTGNYSTSILDFLMDKFLILLSSLHGILGLPELVVVFIYNFFVYLYECIGSICSQLLNYKITMVIYVMLMLLLIRFNIIVALLNHLERAFHLLSHSIPLYLGFVDDPADDIRPIHNEDIPVVQLLEERLPPHHSNDEMLSSTGINCTQNDFNCVVCQDNEKNIVLLPCKHLCLCLECCQTINRMASNRRTCPLCRVKIRDYINVYL